MATKLTGHRELAKVKVICTICGAEYEMQYGNYLTGMRLARRHVCIDCFTKQQQAHREIIFQERVFES